MYNDSHELRSRADVVRCLREAADALDTAWNYDAARGSIAGDEYWRCSQAPHVRSLAAALSLDAQQVVMDGSTWAFLTPELCRELAAVLTVAAIRGESEIADLGGVASFPDGGDIHVLTENEREVEVVGVDCNGIRFAVALNPVQARLVARDLYRQARVAEGRTAS